MDCSPRNRRDAIRQPEGQESYYILINTSSTKINETEKSSYGMDEQQNGLRYGPS